MEEFQKHAEGLGESPYRDEEMTAAKAARDRLLDKYGPRFGGNYGWAHDYVAAKDQAWAKTNVTFQAIEERSAPTTSGRATGSRATAFMPTRWA
jgi:hypothetical protein